MSIRHLNWDEIVDVSPAWRPGTWRLWALWPSPIDHDSCFASAGFADFEDGDDAWSEAFATLVQDSLTSLQSYGRPCLLHGEQPFERGKARPGLGDAVLAAASNDNFPACVVGFGSPPKALLRTGEGHPLLWIASSCDMLEPLLAISAKYGGAQRRTLDWTHLL